MSWLSKFRSKRVNTQLADDLLSKAKKEVEKMPPINIFVAGKTGSGKSTLINAIFREEVAKTGVGMPVTQQVERITKEGMPLTLYDTKGLELTAISQQEVLKSIGLLIQRQEEQGEQYAIHVAYYCVNSTMARIEPFELELITVLAKQVPVILVCTQNFGEQGKAFVEHLKTMQLPVKAIIPVLAKPYSIGRGQKISEYGLQELIDTTLEVVPSQVHQAFINAQRVDLQRKVTNARSWANKYITTAFGIGFTPIPIADATVLVPMQITMLGHITAIFGLSLDKSQVISLLAGIGGTGSATYIGKFIVGSAAKLIPGLGTVAGGVISGTTAGSLTITLAYSYIEVLRQISKAELIGRDLKLTQLQQLMSQNFNEQMQIATKYLPESLKAQLPEWSRAFFKDIF